MTISIAILYICTGKYHVFWKNFYRSAQQYFFRDAKKTYFVFSDADTSLFDEPNVRFIYQKKLGWPDDTLRRFHMFSRVESQLRNYDFIFFFNANVQFQAPIGEEILPTAEEGLVVVQHPGHYNNVPSDFPYERDARSIACIPYGKGKIYVMGGVNGGRTDAYLDLINDLSWAVDKDLEKGVVALWHDESHLNKYILNKNIRILPPSYGFPENSSIPYSNIVTILDKNNWGGHNFLRGIKGVQNSQCPSAPFWKRMQRMPRKLMEKLFKYLKLICS